MKWSYAEMAVTIKDLGLEWVLNNVDDCLRQLIQNDRTSAGRTRINERQTDEHRQSSQTFTQLLPAR